MKRKSLVILDRDGVLNKMVMDPEHGTIDSPLHPDQVEVVSEAPEALGALTQKGFDIVIATNQPAAAKGKTTRKNLELVHARVLELVQSRGGLVLDSYICFHRSEDGCVCRKPNTGLLEQAFRTRPEQERGKAWMVGDGLTDVLAGHRFGVKTAFIGAHKLDTERVFDQQGVMPTLWVENLKDFAEKC